MELGLCEWARNLGGEGKGKGRWEENADGVSVGENSLGSRTAQISVQRSWTRWERSLLGSVRLRDLSMSGGELTGASRRFAAATKKIDVLPVFITCDPARDDVAAVKAYIAGTLRVFFESESARAFASSRNDRRRHADTTRSLAGLGIDFHPSLIGLTGTYPEIKSCCKA